VAVPLLGLLATVLGFWNARRTAAVVRVDVPIAGCPRRCTALPWHRSPTCMWARPSGAATCRPSWRGSMRWGADMVAITGDLVDGKVSELSAHVAPLSQLRSRHGSYFVTGNHEYYSGAHAWMAELRRLGVQRADQ
jgi:3',5'-cyclic AMP phosphodiesterase CpdA